MAHGNLPCGVSVDRDSACDQGRMAFPYTTSREEIINKHSRNNPGINSHPRRQRTKQ